MTERDERPLSEIQFALGDPNAGSKATTVREILQDCGVKVAQDLIDLGCTGLIVKLDELLLAEGGIAEAQFVRANMGGSICGLPCYVPSDRFCLVHNTVGGLQSTGNKDGPQRNPHPRGLARCSRELTADERAKISGVQDFITHEGAKEAMAHFGAEPVEETASEKILIDESALPGTGRNVVALASFTCPEHIEFNPACRYCLAQSIVEGPFEPTVQLTVDHGADRVLTGQHASLLPMMLKDTSVLEIALYVLAARWVRKLVKE
jgi:hypothetical protein